MKTSHFCLIVLIVCTQSIVIAAEESAPPPDIEEITITRSRPASLVRQEIFRATENVYDLFNALNDDDEYDIHCFEQYVLGSRIKERFCHTNYVENALSNAATDYIQGQQGDPESVQGNTPHLIQAEIRMKNTILKEKMLDLANSNKALNDALLELRDLQEEYSEMLAE